MSLEYRGKLLALVCDAHACGYMFHQPFHASEIRATVQAAKQDGWRTTKNGKRWVHYCTLHAGRTPPRTPPVRRPPPPPIEEGRAWWQE